MIVGLKNRSGRMGHPAPRGQYRTWKEWKVLVAAEILRFAQDDTPMLFLIRRSPYPA
jgi:hypothetical protein